MSKIPTMLAELIEALPAGIRPTEIAIRCEGWSKKVEHHVSVTTIENATYSVGRAVAAQIIAQFDTERKP